MPPTVELEEGLQNGVYLAKLGHFMAPELISVKKIFDKDLTRYHVRAPALLSVPVSDKISFLIYN